MGPKAVGDRSAIPARGVFVGCGLWWGFVSRGTVRRRCFAAGQFGDGKGELVSFAQETEHAGRRMVLAGQWQDLAAYYRADDGTAWQWSQCTQRWSNCGDYAEFVAQFAGRYRGTLLAESEVAL